MNTDARPLIVATIAGRDERARYTARITTPAERPRSSGAPVTAFMPCYIRLVSLDIVSVDSSRDLRRFIDLPWRIYNPVDHPQWVPPLRIAVRDALDKKSNPFYRAADRQLFLAVRNGTLVGRIAAIENR